MNILESDGTAWMDSISLSTCAKVGWKAICLLGVTVFSTVMKLFIRIVDSMFSQHARG